MMVLKSDGEHPKKAKSDLHVIAAFLRANWKKCNLFAGGFKKDYIHQLEFFFLFLHVGNLTNDNQI